MNKEFDVNDAIKQNKLELILNFLTKHTHQFGSLKPADEIIYNLCGVKSPKCQILCGLFKR